MFNLFDVAKFEHRLAQGSSRSQLSVAVLAAGIIALAGTMPVRADTIDTYALSPGTTFIFNGGISEGATATFQVDVTNDTILSGTLTLQGNEFIHLIRKADWI